MGMRQNLSPSPDILIPMPTIVTSLYPSILESYALAKLTPKTLLLVPNAAAGRRLRLKSESRGLVLTIGQVAKRALDKAAWRRLEPSEALAWLEETALWLGNDFLGRLLVQRGNLEALQSQLTEFSRANLEPNRLLAVAGSERLEALALLYDAWLKRLTSEQVFTSASLEQMAVLVLEPCLIVVHGFAYLDAAQVALLQAVALPNSLLTLPCASGLVFAEAQRTIEALAWGVLELPNTPKFVGERLAAQFAEIPIDTTTASLAELGTLESECRFVLSQVRSWLEAGLETRDIALIVRDEAAYLPTLESVSAEFGVSLVSDRQIPALETAPGQWVQLWLEAAVSGFAYAATRRWLAHPAGRSCVQLSAAIRGLATANKSGLGTWQDFQTEALELLWLPEESSDYPSLILGGLRWAGVTDVTGLEPRSVAALNRIARVLRDMTGVWRLENFVKAFLERLNSERVALLPGRSGVRVLTPLGALARSFKKLIVLGINDGDYPRYQNQTGLLDGFAKDALSEHELVLPTTRARVGVERALFYSAISSARETVLFTRPMRDLAGRIIAKSPFLRTIQLETKTLPELPFQSAQAAQISCAKAGEYISKSALIEVRRESGELPDSFDGMVRGLPEWLDKTWSASQLHNLGSCRFKWLAAKPLRLEPLPEPPRNIDPSTFGNVYHKALEKIMLEARDKASEAGRNPSQADFLAELESGFQFAESIFQDALSGSYDWNFERFDALRSLEKLLHWDDLIMPNNSPVQFEVNFPVSSTETAYFWYNDAAGNPQKILLRGIIDRLDTRENGGRELIDYKSGDYISRVASQVGFELNLEIQLVLYAVSGLVSLGAAVFDETNLCFPPDQPAHRARYISVREAKDIDPKKEPLTLETSSPEWTERLTKTQAFVATAMQAVSSGALFPMPDLNLKACEYCKFKDLCRKSARFDLKRQNLGAS
ncbi:MAG: hypothetical protein RLZZ156_1505 [Deinococcota bacterium]|jgi:RecB family exonuclease